MINFCILILHFLSILILEKSILLREDKHPVFDDMQKLDSIDSDGDLIVDFVDLCAKTPEWSSCGRVWLSIG